MQHARLQQPHLVANGQVCEVPGLCSAHAARFAPHVLLAGPEMNSMESRASCTGQPGCAHRRLAGEAGVAGCPSP